MPPIKDETVDALRDLVYKLEARVQDLEARLHPGDGRPKAGGTDMRMILMGPPGAGMSMAVAYHSCWPGRADNWHRQRDTGSQDQGEVLYLSSGM